MKVYKEMDMTDFEPWSGAVDTYKVGDRLDQFQSDRRTVSRMDADETINDILWFEGKAKKMPDGAVCMLQRMEN